MSSSETLMAPGQTVDAVDMHAAATPMPEGVGYAHQLADGRVVYAESAEVAIQECPVLGRWAIEAPDKVSLFLKIAAKGGSIIAAASQRTGTEPKPEAKPVVAQKPDKTTDSVSRAPEPKVEEPLRAELVIPVAELRVIEHNYIPDLNRQDEFLGQQKEAPAPKEYLVEPDLRTTVMATIASETADCPLPDTNHFEITTPVEPVDVKVFEQDRPEADVPGSLAILPRAVESLGSKEVMTLPDEDNDTVEMALEPTVTAEMAVDTSDIVEAHVVETEMVSPTDSIEPNQFLQAGANDNEVTETNISQEAEAAIDERLELLFDTETIETYKQLIALAAPETSEPATQEIEGTTATELVPEVVTETVAIPDFEAYAASLPASAEPVTLEVIQEQADEQPLEQTLIQLTNILSEPAEALEQNILQEIMHGIEKALPACYAYEETEEAKPKITPEMTEKLLILLRAIGYQHPGEALVEFVAKYDIGYLLQAMEYLCQLNADNRQEFLVAAVATSATNDDTVHMRLGRMLLGLIAKTILKPSI